MGGWSFRAALCRYAQPQPERSAAVLSILRRVESQFAGDLAALRDRGPELLERAAAISDPDLDATVDAASSSDDPDGSIVALLSVAEVLDRLGDSLASWALDRAADRPDGAVDETVDRVLPLLTTLGVPEEAPPPRGARSRG